MTYRPFCNREVRRVFLFRRWGPLADRPRTAGKWVDHRGTRRKRASASLPPGNIRTAGRNRPNSRLCGIVLLECSPPKRNDLLRGKNKTKTNANRHVYWVTIAETFFSVGAIYIFLKRRKCFQNFRLKNKIFS